MNSDDDRHEINNNPINQDFIRPRHNIGQPQLGLFRRPQRQQAMLLRRDTLINRKDFGG